MKDKIKILVTCLLAVCFLFSDQFSANAETTTEATIEITAGTGPTLPVNPEDPSKDLTGEPSVTGSLAILTISNFNFGTITAESAAGLYNITTAQPNIQVVDLRGVGSGWSVSAAVTGFKSNDAPSLPGASIHIYSGRPNSLVSASYAPSQTANVELTTDNTPVKVITAPGGTGMGLWVMRWYPSSGETTAYVQLEIPAGVAIVGTHTATINWTLKDTP